MDQSSLYQAAAKGDVAFLNDLCSTIDSATSSTNSAAELERYLLSRTNDTGDNIIHVAVDNGQQLFISETLQKVQLSSQLKVELICQKNNKYCNPLHIAASKGHLAIVEILVESYRKLSRLAIDEANTRCSETRVAIGDDDKQPPWAATSDIARTPLHSALERSNERVAAYILSQDMGTLCTIVDDSGKSPLFLAVENGCERIALQILTSGCSYDLGRLSYNNSTILHNASKITEQVGVLLLKEHPELLRERTKNGETFLHSLAREGQLDSLACLVKGKVFLSWSAHYREQLSQRDNFGSNPIHGAVLGGNVEVMKLLVEAYFQAEPISSNYCNGIHELEESLPWLHTNSKYETPLEMAILLHKDDIVAYLLTFDSVRDGLSNDNDNGNGKNPLFLALECGRASVVKIIMRRVPCGTSSRLRSGPRGQNPLHVAWKCPGMAKNLVEYLGADLLHKEDESGKTPLDYPAQEGDRELQKLAVEYAGTTWVEACRRGQLGVLQAFIEYYDFEQVYREERDTQLHHMRSNSREVYEEFLAIPVIRQLKNAPDNDGATPLHRAIERKDIIYVELLLSIPGIDWNIKDNQEQTALDQLAKLYHESPDWYTMCNRTKINPRMRYIKMNLVEIRQTLSVVAALLATLTFAAAFTIPGGYNDDGYAISARRAAFIAFLLSDTYAMCCSMLVLFRLMSAMISSREKSPELVDKSFTILQQAFYGTLVAFMTGVYTVVSHDSLWTAILVCVMCSVFAVEATRQPYTLQLAP